VHVILYIRFDNLIKYFLIKVKYCKSMKNTLLKCVESVVSKEISTVNIVKECLSECRKATHLNAFTEIDGTKALEDAERFDKKLQYNQLHPLLSGSMISIKDNFCVCGSRTSAGSKMLSEFISPYDSTVVSHMTSNGAITFGKTNMDEFAMGSSGATSVFGASVNPWSYSVTASENSHRCTKNADIGDNSVEHDRYSGGETLSPGGSSSGGAVATSAGLSHASIGSDTGGSIRQPASFCGVVGMKPTYGSISRHGLIAYASSLDTPSVLTRSVTDAAVVFDSLSGRDEQDPSGWHRPTVEKVIPKLFEIHPDEIRSSALGSTSLYRAETISALVKRASLLSSLKGLRVGIPQEFHVHEIDPVIVQAWQLAIDTLEDAGAVVTDVSVPSLKIALPCYYILACAEASSNLSRYDGIRYGSRSSVITSSFESMKSSKSTLINTLLREISVTRSEAFGDEVIRRILTGTYVLSQSAYHDYYMRAMSVRESITSEMIASFQHVDIVLGPTVPFLPFSLSSSMDVSRMMLNDVLTVPANLAGIPAMSIPVGVAEKVTDRLVSGTDNSLRHYRDSSAAAGDGSVGSVRSKSIVPIGIQLMAPTYQEYLLFKAALAIEQRIGDFTKQMFIVN